jgi:predicted ATPase/class 3 adenylate cyclase
VKQQEEINSIVERSGHQITQQLHVGSRFLIYRGVSNDKGMKVILKMMKDPYPTRQDLDRLRKEFMILQRFKHPNILGTIGVELFENRLALIREDIVGENLQVFLEGRGLELDIFFTIALQMARAILALHSERIIHKKISSSNVLINRANKQVKLAGFSIATEMTREPLLPNEQDIAEAELAYISPEQTGRMNRTLDYRTDFYSLGAVFYELLTGRPPFVTNDTMELIHCHIAIQPKPPRELRPVIPEMLSALVMKLLSKNEDDRYQSANGLLWDLELCYNLYTTGGVNPIFSLGCKDVSDQFRIPGKLYGRTEELDQLVQAFQVVEKGRSQVLMVNGYSGVGKSRLVNHFEKTITGRGGFFIAGKFDQFKRDVPLSALLAALRVLVRQLLGKSENQVAQWRNKLIEAVGISGQLIIDVVPEVELLIGHQPAVPDLPVIEANNRFNESFSRFIRIFATPEHPLCIFLDDLQWMDTTTRQWIEAQLSDQSLAYFLFIGAYRDNEVTASHPLMLMIDRLKQNRIDIKSIHLEALSLPTLTDMVADTLAATRERCLELATLVHQKTGGNPFFVRQCLLSLYERGAIYFEPNNQLWSYNLEKVHKAEISDNVLGLMTQLIQRLPAEVQNILKFAACIGSQFSLQTLSIVSEEDFSTVTEHIGVAVQQGLVVPVNSQNKESLEQFTFLHDRVQQAALSLLPEQEKKIVSLQIGRLLLKGIENLENDENIYNVADHLNAAADLVTDHNEQVKIVYVNLAAGSRAKRAAAFQPANLYITQAMNLLPAEIWDNPSTLTAELLLQRAESEHLCGNNDEARKLYEQALIHATGTIERAKIYQRQIHYYTNLRKFKEAYEAGREAVLQLGVKLPSKFVLPLLVKDLVLYRLLRGRREIKDILNLPEMQDEKLKMAILLMSTFARAAYQLKPELCVAVCTRMVNICLRHGNTEGGFIGFMALGPIFFGAVLKQKQTGFEFGQLTLNLVEKYKSIAFKAETNFVVGYFAMPWRRPANEMEAYWQVAYEAGLQTGDFFHASCACCGTIQSYYMRGVSFNEIMKESDRYLEFLQRINNNEGVLTINAVRQSIRNLRGETVSPTSYSDDTFIEEDYINSLRSFGSRHFAHYYFINKMQTLYLWKEYDKAYEVSLLSDNYLKDSPGMMHTAEHYFYKALIICALFPKSSSSKQRQWKRTLHKIRYDFKKFADECPSNFLHKRQLLKAEIEVVQGNNTEAETLYAASIESALKYGYKNIYALASARLVIFYTSTAKRRMAAFHLQDAVYSYNNLGATAYGAYLVKSYPELIEHTFDKKLLNETARNSDEQSTGNEGTVPLDLETVLKSSQAISREIRLKDLLSTLMKIIIENAGAQRMVLLLMKDDKLFVTAECLAGSDPVEVINEISLENYTLLAKAVVNYVARTHDPVILEDAVNAGTFTNDVYIHDYQITSVLCAPLVQQGKLTGVIYLENNLTYAAFTKERIDLVILLSGQMAISIENALLYENLEEKVKERTRELKEERDISENLLLNILPAETAEELKKTGASKAKDFDEVTVLFTDFKNFTLFSEQLNAQELVGEINYCYSAFDNIIGKYGIEKIKTIGDSYMCAGGLPVEKKTNPEDTLSAALEIRDFMLKEKQKRRAKGKEYFEIRIGLHTGPVVAGIVGIRKFAYDIWGDTVNIASRMESSGEPGKINISGSTHELIKDKFNCTYRGKIEAKNKGTIDMYFVEHPL